MKDKCHLRLKINTMVLHHPHSPKKWQRVSKITIRIHYYRPHSNFHSEKNTWTLNWRGGFVGAKFTNPSKFEFTITDHWWRVNAIWDSKSTQWNYNIHIHQKKGQRVSKITIRIHYYRPHSNFHHEKNTWTLNWREGFVGAKFTNPSKFEFTITDHWWSINVIWDSKSAQWCYIIHNHPKKWQRVSKITIRIHYDRPHSNYHSEQKIHGRWTGGEDLLVQNSRTHPKN